LTKVIFEVGFDYGTGWEADDRQGDGAGKGNLPASHFFRTKSLPSKNDSRSSVRRSGGVEELIEQFAEASAYRGGSDGFPAAKRISLMILNK
jgi:hypothetical protein